MEEDTREEYSGRIFYPSEGRIEEIPIRAYASNISRPQDSETSQLVKAVEIKK